MKVTEVEKKESTIHCCGNGCRWRDSAEHKEESGALIDQRITENNNTNADRRPAGSRNGLAGRRIGHIPELP